MLLISITSTKMAVANQYLMKNKGNVKWGHQHNKQGMGYIYQAVCELLKPTVN